MAADRDGNPYIASYWRDAGETIPQYRVVYRAGGAWQRLTLGFRSTPFSLSGQGTKAIPVSRPQIMLSGQSALLVFRDEERGSKVSVAVIDDFRTGRWTVRDLSADPVGAWEPSFDTELWRRDGELHLVLQTVRQVDGEGAGAGAPSKVRVLQWRSRQ
jgi:hypothetical protein